MEPSALSKYPGIFLLSYHPSFFLFFCDNLNFSAHFSTVSFPALFFYFTRQRGHTSVPLINSSQFFQRVCLSMPKNRCAILNAIAPIMFLPIPFYKNFLFPHRIAPTTKKGRLIQARPFFLLSFRETQKDSYRHPDADLISNSIAISVKTENRMGQLHCRIL